LGSPVWLDKEPPKCREITVATEQQDMQAHVRGYSAFSRMIKWGAILSLIVALLVVLIISH
jgi:hypothetical protein